MVSSYQGRVPSRHQRRSVSVPFLVHCCVMVILACTGAVHAADSEAPAEDPPVWDHDAIAEGGPSIEPDDPDRALVWSSIGIAIDLPRGIGTTSRLPNSDVTLERDDGHDSPRFQAALAVTNLLDEPKKTLAEGLPNYLDWSSFDDTFRLRSVGGVKKTARSLTRLYRSKTDGVWLSGVHIRVVFEFDQLDVRVVSDRLNPTQLAKEVAALSAIRAITSAEWFRLPPRRDWRKELEGRRVELQEGGITKYVVAFCEDGRYRFVSPSGKRLSPHARVGNVPAEGQWGLAYSTMWAGTRGVWIAERLSLDDRVHLGPFGSTEQPPPYKEAGELCAR